MIIGLNFTIMKSGGGRSNGPQYDGQDSRPFLTFLGHICYLRVGKTGSVGFCKSSTQLLEEDNLIGDLVMLFSCIYQGI
jgi:hypothetical protein